MNTRGLFANNNQTKTLWLADLAKQKNSFLMCLTETHLNESISNNELVNSHWDIIRADREIRQCGGTAILYRSDIIIDHGNILKVSNSYCEMICCFFPSINLANITIYRPPGCPTIKFQDTLNQAEDWITKLEKAAHKPTILLNGDLNLPFMENWNQAVTDSLLEAIECRKTKGKSISSDKEQALLLYNLVSEHFMIQSVNDPTRYKNILDLQFCNDQNTIFDYEILDTVITSDHAAIIFSTNIALDKSKCPDKPKSKIYSTKIHEFDTLTATKLEWDKVRHSIA